LLDAVRSLYELRDLESFPAHALSVLGKSIPCDCTGYNEINLRRRRYVGLTDPPEVLDFPDVDEIFRRHGEKHPLIAHYDRSGDGRALRISDFLSQPQFRSLALYNEFYRWAGIEHQMAATVNHPAKTITAFAFNRGRSDFSERERRLLDTLRPHLYQAYRNAETVTALQRTRTDDSDSGATTSAAISLDAGGRPVLIPERAATWLARYLPVSPRGRGLPEALTRWVRYEIAALDGTDPPPAARGPLVVERDGGQLVIRLVSANGRNMLLLEERSTRLAPESLRPLGLTPREAEVLTWVALGKTNIDIGVILGARPRTVAKHLERIFVKLGVETRTAAAAHAHAAATRRS